MALWFFLKGNPTFSRLWAVFPGELVQSMPGEGWAATATRRAAPRAARSFGARGASSKWRHGRTRCCQVMLAQE